MSALTKKHSAPPLTVMHLTTDSSMGGAEHLLCAVARHYDHRRFRMVFVSLRPRGLWHGHLLALGERCESLNLTRAMQLPAGFAGLCRLLKIFQPNVLHTHLIHAGLLGRIVAPRFPDVTLLHSRHYASFYEHSGGFFWRRADRWLAQHSPAIVAISKAVKKDLTERLLVPAERVHRIDNGIDVEMLKRQQGDRLTLSDQEQWKAAAPRIGIVANFAPCKGHEVVIDAAAEILKHYPNAVFFLAGDGPRRSVLEEKIRTLGLAGAFAMTGYIDPIAAFLSEIDLLLVPSLTEGFGLAACEAMALGTPVIASRVEGLEELIDDGETGWLFTPGDAADLANVVIKVLKKSTAKKQLIKRAQTRAQEDYDVVRMTRAWESLYQKLTEGRTTP